MHDDNLNKINDEWNPKSSLTISSNINVGELINFIYGKFSKHLLLKRLTMKLLKHSFVVSK